MKKIKLLMPMLGVATLTGTMMPLVSCGCGKGGKIVSGEYNPDYVSKYDQASGYHFTKNDISNTTQQYYDDGKKIGDVRELIVDDALAASAKWDTWGGNLSYQFNISLSKVELVEIDGVHLLNISGSSMYEQNYGFAKMGCLSEFTNLKFVVRYHDSPDRFPAENVGWYIEPFFEFTLDWNLDFTKKIIANSDWKIKYHSYMVEITPTNSDEWSDVFGVATSKNTIVKGSDAAGYHVMTTVDPESKILPDEIKENGLDLYSTSNSAVYLSNHFANIPEWE